MTGQTSGPAFDGAVRHLPESWPYRIDIPYVLDVQCRLFDDSNRRLIMPLARRTLPSGREPSPSLPVTIAGETVIAEPLLLVSLPRSALGEAVGNLSQVGDDIITAIDKVISRA